MSKSLQLIIRLLCLAAFLWAAPNVVRAEADVWDGTATMQPDGWSAGNTALSVSTAAELAWVAKTVNDGTTTGSGSETGFEGCTITLNNDIDLNSKEWTPIGTSDNPFKGNFNGNKHTIRNLKIDIRNKNAGLFGAGNNITIENLGVVISEEGIKITLESNAGHAGGIIGFVDGGTIKSCFVVGGPIKGVSMGQNLFLGGIAGLKKYGGNDLTVSYCYVMVSEITSAITGTYINSILGGIIGDGDKKNISNCISLVKSLTIHSNTPEGTLSMQMGRIISGGSSPGPTLQNNYSSPFCYVSITGHDNYATSGYIADGAGNNKNGADLTKQNFNGDPGNALDGWESAGWTLHDGQLPTLDPTAEGLPIDQFILAGSGVNMDPYQISDEREFLYYTYQINNGTTGFNNTEYFKLANDITLPSDWTPIGTTAHPFKGTFDGDNHTVSLSLKADVKQAQAGLFGTIDGGATARKVAVNVVADGITSTASGVESRAGAIAAVNKGTIDQCYVSGEGFVLSSDGTNRHAGGIAGDNSGTISNCYNLIPVKVNDSSDSYLGGIAGYNTGTIEYSFAAGEVSIAADAVVSSLTNGMDEAAGGIVGFNDHENAGIVRHSLAVNAKIPADAHRVIGTGADTDDVNNFSFFDMPRQITKSADTYDPQEGTPLTSSNLNSDADGCFNSWNISIWNLDNISTYLPKLKGFTSQPEKQIAPYLLYTVQIDPVSNGTLLVTRPNPLNGSEIVVNNNEQLPYNTVLTITAIPDANYELDALTVNGTTFSNGTFHTVTDKVTVKVTFKKKEVKPDPEPSPEPEPTVYYTVTLPAVEGAATDPVAGAYEVESWGSFRFYLSLDKEYDQSTPIVTTSRGETITPRTSDGAYIIKYVRQPLDILIDGIIKNPDPVANEKIEANHPKVWKTGNELHIQAVSDEPGYIYTADGKLQTVCHLIAGEVETVRLPDGIYFVRIGKERFKIVL